MEFGRDLFKRNEILRFEQNDMSFIVLCTIVLCTIVKVILCRKQRRISCALWRHLDTYPFRPRYLAKKG